MGKATAKAHTQLECAADVRLLPNLETETDVPIHAACDLSLDALARLLLRVFAATEAEHDEWTGNVHALWNRCAIWRIR